MKGERLGEFEEFTLLAVRALGDRTYAVPIQQYVENATPVTVFGLTVAPGDLVHADRHGAVVVPPEVVPRLAEGIARLRATEALVLGPARQPGFDFAAFEAAWTAFENART